MRSQRRALGPREQEGCSLQTPALPDRDRELAALQERLVNARRDGKPRAIAQALFDLCQATRERGIIAATIRYAEEAWDLAQGEQLWDLTSQLALFFADICCQLRSYSHCYDHYANACAYALLVSPDYFWEVVEHVDDVLTDLVREGQLLQAIALCEMLISYEEPGGLGQRVPAFAAHYVARRNWLERLRVQTRLEAVTAQN